MKMQKMTIEFGKSPEKSSYELKKQPIYHFKRIICAFVGITVIKICI